MKPLTRTDLKGVPCSDPTCPDEPGHLAQVSTVVGPCHPRAGLVAVYRQEDGVLGLFCGVCTRTVVEIQVAQGMVH